MLSVKSCVPGLEKPPDSLTFMIRKVLQAENKLLKMKSSQNGFKKPLLEYEYMHYYRAGNTGREETSVCSFSGSLHLQMNKTVH